MLLIVCQCCLAISDYIPINVSERIARATLAVAPREIYLCWCGLELAFVVHSTVDLVFSQERAGLSCFHYILDFIQCENKL